MTDIVVTVVNPGSSPVVVDGETFAGPTVTNGAAVTLQYANAGTTTASPAWNSITGKPAFAAVATSGSYNDLSDRPAAYSLPTATGSVLGGVKIGSGVTITDGVISVSTNYAATSHSHAASDITSGTIDTARLASGTANSGTFLRGDQTWAAAGGSSSASDLTSGTVPEARLPQIIVHPFLLMGG